MQQGQNYQDVLNGWGGGGVFLGHFLITIK